MKLKYLYDLITESKNVGTVYHFVAIEYALKIISNDFIKAQSTHSGLSFLKKRFDKNAEVALSTTRDRNFENTRQKFSSDINATQIGGVDVIFVLDGTKMSNKYKSVAYDDFKNRGDIKKNEAEELWYGARLDKDRGIVNVSKYLKKVIISDEFTNTFTTSGRLRKYTDVYALFNDFISALKAKNIPYEYEDKSFDESKIEENKSLIDALKLFGIKKYKIVNGYINVSNSIELFLGAVDAKLTPLNLKLGTVDGDVTVREGSSSKDLVGCPIKVNGNFYCSGKSLTSLKGAPEFVRDDVSFSYNDLKSLKYFPKYVGNDIDLNLNNLQSMVGLPKIVKGNLFIRNNPIKTLKGMPKKIEGDIYVDFNKEIDEDAIRKVSNIVGKVYR